MSKKSRPSRLTEQETEKFLLGLERFMANAKVSANVVAAVTDISVPSLQRWRNKKSRPYYWMAQNVIKNVRILNKAHKEKGIYNQIANLKPADKVAFLQEVLRDG